MIALRVDFTLATFPLRVVFDLLESERPALMDAVREVVNDEKDSGAATGVPRRVTARWDYLSKPWTGGCHRIIPANRALARASRAVCSSSSSPVAMRMDLTGADHIIGRFSPARAFRQSRLPFAEARCGLVG